MAASYISVPRDLTKVKSKVMFNLTKNLSADYNDELKKNYEDGLRNLEQVESYCEKNHISCLKLSSFEATCLYDNGTLGGVIREANSICWRGGFLKK